MEVTIEVTQKEYQEACFNMVGFCAIARAMWKIPGFTKTGSSYRKLWFTDELGVQQYTDMPADLKLAQQDWSLWEHHEVSGFREKLPDLRIVLDYTPGVEDTLTIKEFWWIPTAKMALGEFYQILTECDRKNSSVQVTCTGDITLF